MDLYDPNRFRNRKHLSSTERFLGVPTHAPSLQNPTPSNTDEFIEDDVVFLHDDITEPSSSSSPIPTPNTNHHKGSPFGPPDTFGILAALPENDASPNAPVNVPVMSPAMMKAARRRRGLDKEDEDGDAAEEDEEMLPPHEIVARKSAVSPMLACSVLEGVGRTLKGRDLRQVRNAVLRQTAGKWQKPKTLIE
ncbi:Senescence regulator S40 [Sesbania bispinosa]|nr:Senescence regulator S40 [Sesbania bispinosa]